MVTKVQAEMIEAATGGGAELLLDYTFDGVTLLNAIDLPVSFTESGLYKLSAFVRLNVSDGSDDDKLFITYGTGAATTSFPGKGTYFLAGSYFQFDETGANQAHHISNILESIPLYVDATISVDIDTPGAPKVHISSFTAGDRAGGDIYTLLIQGSQGDSASDNMRLNWRGAAKRFDPSTGYYVRFWRV